MKANKRYELTVARIEHSSGRGALVVLIPWEHFSLPDGPDAYLVQLSQVDATIAIVAKRPDEKWESVCLEEERFARLSTANPLSELAWHKMSIETEFYPWELFGKL